jgi:chromosome partitioning protein
VCGTEFEVHFRYQLEERAAAGADGEPSVTVDAFCSQRCLERSHHSRSGGLASCDACATRFQVELVSQVLFTGGRRHYACSAECRARIREGMRTIRLGELLKPAAEQSEGAASSEVDALPSNPSDDELPSMPGPVEPSVAQRTAGSWFERPAPVWKRKLRDDAPRVIAVFNHKGGTGKTTTAITLAAGLAERGQHVLLVDTDAQGNVAVCLGAEVKRSLYHVTCS